MSIYFLRLPLRFIRIPLLTFVPSFFQLRKAGKLAFRKTILVGKGDRYMSEREKYFKLTETKKGALYHEWVRRNGYIGFTDWEVRVLRGDIKIDLWDLVKERKL